MRLNYKWTTEEMISKGQTCKENIDIIKTWLDQSKPKYVPLQIQDESIVLFLIACNNDISLTKRTIIAFYECKRDGPEIFDDRNLESDEIKTALNTVHMSSIPTRTEENYVVHYFKINDTNYKNFDLVAIMKVSYMLIDVAQDKNPPNGLIVVIDAKGIGLMHMTKIKVGAIRKYIQFLQEGFPMQLKMIHIINSIYLVDKILDIVKIFMKAEILNQLKLHSPNIDQEDLFKILPKKCWSCDYGGDLPTVKELHDVTMEQFREKQEFWDIEEKLRKED